MLSFLRRYKVLDYSCIFLLIIIASYLYKHLYSADQYAMDRFGFAYKIILWSIRIGIPLLLTSLIVVFIKFRQGKLPIGGIILFLCSTIICVLLIFPLGNYYYNRATRINQKLDMYHPFLQLKPNMLNVSSKDNDTLRILCLGGSTTEWGDRVSNIGWPKRVENMLLNKYPHKKIEIINGGRQWYTSLHTLINYQVNLRKIAPDIVMVMHGINDLLCNADFSYLSKGEFREDYGHFLGAVTRIIARGNFIQKLFREINFWSNKERELIDTTHFPGLVSFKRNLSTLIELCRNDSIEVVLITQPTSLKKFMTEDEIRKCYMLKIEAVGVNKRWSHKTAYEGMKAYNDLATKVAAENDVYLIDLASNIPSSFEYFSDEVHYKDITFDIIATHVSNELVNFGLIN